jgi:hypothetical protein
MSQESSPVTQPAPQTQLQPDVPLKELLSWSSPIRPFQKRSREFYTTVGSIVFLVCVILLFIREFLLIMVLVALSFFLYAIGTIKPEEIEHIITNKYIKTGGKQFLWGNLGSFWFENRFGSKILLVENNFGFPSRLMLVLGRETEDSVRKVFSQYLPQATPEKTQFEKAGDWLQKKVPLETIEEVSAKQEARHSKSLSKNPK